MRCFDGPCVAALHVWVALIVPGCVHVCLCFAVDVGSSGVCMFHVLILSLSLSQNMRCFHGPCIAALHVWVALIVPGCVHVCLRFAVVWCKHVSCFDCDVDSCFEL